MPIIAPGDVVRRKPELNNSDYYFGDEPFIVKTIEPTNPFQGWVADGHGISLHNPEDLVRLRRYNEHIPDTEAINSARRKLGLPYTVYAELLPEDEQTIEPLAEWERELLEPVKRPVQDAINPAHYQQGGLEAIDVLEAFGLTRDGRLFNVGKYVLRAGKKDDELQDLKKAQWYLERLINSLERAK